MIKNNSYKKPFLSFMRKDKTNVDRYNYSEITNSWFLNIYNMTLTF